MCIDFLLFFLAATLSSHLRVPCLTRFRRADFGNGLYNDHHFHYGYFVYALAIIFANDPHFAAAYADKALQLVREYACSNHSDPYFPRSRCKDWWDFHSWANGLTPFGDGKNQESTSEAVFAYYGVMLLGLSLGDRGLANWGRVLMQTEIHAAQRYWQIRYTGEQRDLEDSGSVYPPPFSHNLCVGVLWGSKADYRTWFGANTEFIFGIQQIPVSPISEALLAPGWLQCVAAANEREHLFAHASDAWKSILYAGLAQVDAETYWRKVRAPLPKPRTQSRMQHAFSSKHVNVCIC